ncbi:MAG: RNA polymerase sigma factor [Caldilineaceae bacterium]|nr:RNA polymerase sigma factor [Caldilineaceae bacterium]
MNEIEAIHRACRGDEEAWLLLVRTHQTALFRLAYLLLGDADEAEDVAQDALIRAYRGLARFDPARPLRPWLLQIVRNQAHNRRRTARRYLAAVTRWWHQMGPPAVVPDPATPAAGELLRQAVQRLEPIDQEVIYLRYFLELSVAETAATLAIAEGTVKSRLSRALSRLRTVIEMDYPSLRGEEWS